MLVRNGEMKLGAWRLKESSSGKAEACVRYFASAEAVSRAFFSLICREILDEVREFDEGLRSKGIV